MENKETKEKFAIIAIGGFIFSLIPFLLRDHGFGLYGFQAMPVATAITIFYQGRNIQGIKIWKCLAFIGLLLALLSTGILLSGV